MRTWLAVLGTLGLLAGCERRSGQETRSGTDTIIRSSTVKDTTVVHVDTTIRVDTARQGEHLAVGAEDSAAGRALNWVPAPPGLPAGARMAVVRGDPTKAGPFTLRVDLPGGYEVRPHWHPTSERIRVIEGTLMLGNGEHWSAANLRPLSSGAETTMAARHPHYVQAKGRTVLEIRSVGPFEITYVNPADDPRKAPIQ
jgi:hypothetical protein